MRWIMTLVVITSIAYAEKFSVGMYFGYGSTNKYYDETGKVISGNSIFSFDYSVLNLGLSGKYYILSSEVSPKIYIGTSFGFNQSRISSKAGSFEETQSSGFSPQYLDLFLGSSFIFANAKLGFQLDLGPKPDSNKISNSDRQNAILFGLGMNVPFMAGLSNFHANFDYIYTLERTENSLKFDDGDYIVFSVGGGYGISLSELASLSLGIDIVYYNRTKDKTGESGNNLSLMPYFNYKTGPLSLWLKLGTKYGVLGEYTYSGISIMGKSSLKTLLGFSAGVNVSY